jgi:hypothetical protein
MTGRKRSLARPGGSKRPKLRLTAQDAPESSILTSIMAWLFWQKGIVWYQRMNSGAYQVGEGRARRYVRFGFKGCPDILGQLSDGRLLAIECKTRTGRLSDDQRAFLGRVESGNGIAIVARSISDVATGLARVLG